MLPLPRRVPQLHSVGSRARLTPAGDGVLYLLARFLTAGGSQQHSDTDPDADPNQHGNGGIQAGVIFSPNHVTGAAHPVGSFGVGVARAATQIVDAVA